VGILNIVANLLGARNKKSFFECRIDMILPLTLLGILKVEAVSSEAKQRDVFDFDASGTIRTLPLIHTERTMKFVSALLVASLAGSAVAFQASTPARASSTVMRETKADLEALAPKLNPIVKYWDPLNLVDSSPWGLSQEATIGWLRQSEIKHGRVSMAAFVGYCVQSNFHFPWAMTLDGTPFPSTDLSPPDQWDALPFASKLQIIAFIGFLEWYSELTPGAGAENGIQHYTKGGQPGKYPTFDGIPHPVPLNLFDPFGFSKNASPEKKAKGLQAEINNGRLAMLGIFGFLCEQTISGSVPLLGGIVKPYAGEVMSPFDGNF